MSRYFAIGDIHGCLDLLLELLKRIEVRWSEDRIVFLGDYIDRGPDPKGVIEHILRLRDKHENIVCLMGNHEWMFLNFLDHREESVYLYNGGRSTLRSYGIPESASDRRALLPPEHLRFIETLQPYYETEKYLFVHAGIRPPLPLHLQDPYDLYWIRQEFFLSGHDLDKSIIFAHTPFKSPFIGEKMIGIDTGAVYGGKLTCLELPAMKFHQV